MRGIRRTRRGCRGEIEPLTRLCPHLRRVDQPVATHPDIVIGLRQVRQQIAALIVGHDYATELRRQLGCLGDDPNPRLAALRARDDAADEGRYLLPDLPQADYNVWVRGYG